MGADSSQLKTIELMAGAIQDVAQRMKEHPQLAILMLLAPIKTLNKAYQNLQEAEDESQEV